MKQFIFLCLRNIIKMLILLIPYWWYFMLNVCVWCVTVNVAVNKPACKQYPYRSGNDRYDASNAVAGRKSDLSWGDDQCAASMQSTTATWWMNLANIHIIHHITIYFVTFNLSRASVTVYIANGSHCRFKCATRVFALYLYADNLFLSVY